MATPLTAAWRKARREPGLGAKPANACRRMRPPHRCGTLWLRRLADDTALLLPALPRIEPAGDGAYCATFDELGAGLVGLGHTEARAAAAAGELLRGRVDHALDRGGELAAVLGSLPFIVLPAFLVEVGSRMYPHVRGVGLDWRRRPDGARGVSPRVWGLSQGCIPICVTLSGWCSLRRLTCFRRPVACCGSAGARSPSGRPA